MAQLELDVLDTRKISLIRVVPSAGPSPAKDPNKRDGRRVILQSGTRIDLVLTAREAQKLAKDLILPPSGEN